MELENVQNVEERENPNTRLRHILVPNVAAQATVLFAEEKAKSNL